jgi:hypothetical protein
MGQSPEERAAGAAANAANAAVAQQQKLIKDIYDRAEQYESKALESIPKLSQLAGRLPEDYVTGTRGDFERYTQGLQEQFGQKLAQFDPNVLGSPSQQRLRTSLGESTDAYTRGLTDASSRTTSDIYKTLAVAIPAGEALARSSATNLMLDPSSMWLATKPPLTPKKSSQDLGYADYMRYNV